MVLFNFPRWVVKRILDKKKNADTKILIIGPAGSGKSMAGVTLGEQVDKWIVQSINEVQGIGAAEHGEYFNVDWEHMAIIDDKDLVKLMVKPLKKHSVKVADDCGAAEGVNARRSMSKKNIDLIRIYGTNRTERGVLIICVQDDSFIDKRLRMLANIIIDLREWYSEFVPGLDGGDEIEIRFAKLYKIVMDNTQKYSIQTKKFQVHQHGKMARVETIALVLPSDNGKSNYDMMRTEKQEAETSKVLAEIEAQDAPKDTGKKKCPDCGWTSSVKYFKRTKTWQCTHCDKILNF